MLKNLFLAVLFLCCGLITIFAQQKDPASQKYALVIGNGSYTGLSRLTNPVNDANDMSAALELIGFKVDKVLNGNLDQMESAVLRLKKNLGSSKETYGFFFYAGHGVQSGGENYLIPVDANIPNENFLRNRAVSVQTVLDELNDAGNELNVVVLDACRDNPFGWSRSGSRGLSMPICQHADSIIVYATSAGQKASDGDGRNGLFTSQLLPNILTPGLEVSEVFKLTGADVAKTSSREQIPAVYNQFFGTAYLGETPSETSSSVVRPTPLPLPSRSADEQDSKIAQLWSIGASVGSSFADPWFIGTIRFTLAPVNYSFLEIGFDYGTYSGDSDISYYSLYPYAHLAYYRPFAKRNGLYVGAGGGYMMAEYDFPEGAVSKSSFGADVIAGINIFNILDISYTLRTNFENANNKVAIGYIYRFNKGK